MKPRNGAGGVDEDGEQVTGGGSGKRFGLGLLKVVVLSVVGAVALALIDLDPGEPQGFRNHFVPYLILMTWMCILFTALGPLATLAQKGVRAIPGLSGDMWLGKAVQWVVNVALQFALLAVFFLGAGLSASLADRFGLLPPLAATSPELQPAPHRLAP